MKDAKIVRKRDALATFNDIQNCRSRCREALHQLQSFKVGTPPYLAVLAMYQQSAAREEAQTEKLRTWLEGGERG